MPNSCYCKVRIGAEEKTIAKFCETEFCFEKVGPTPENTNRYEWNCENWGTKWERWNYKLKHRGDCGMEIVFETAWNPPFSLFESLVKEHHDVWLKCDWSEEGGMAGIFIVSWDEEQKKVKIESFEWQDWCLEEWNYRMQNDDSEFFLHRPRSHCKDDEEYNAEGSRMGIKMTRGEEKRMTVEIKADFLKQNIKKPTEDIVRKEMIRRKADELWPEYKN